MYCYNCGSQLEDNVQFCCMCGNHVQNNTKDSDTTRITRSLKTHKIFIIIISILLLLSVALNIWKLPITSKDQSKNNVPGKYSEIVDIAADALLSEWEKTYLQDDYSDKHLEIYHTRIIELSSHITDKTVLDLLDGAKPKYIVEFSIYSNLYQSAPYYYDAHYNDSVLIFEDGTTTVISNFFHTYSGLTYNYDYSSFIDTIVDLGTAENRILSCN